MDQINKVVNQDANLKIEQTIPYTIEDIECYVLKINRNNGI